MLLLHKPLSLMLKQQLLMLSQKHLG